MNRLAVGALSVIIWSMLWCEGMGSSLFDSPVTQGYCGNMAGWFFHLQWEWGKGSTGGGYVAVRRDENIIEGVPYCCLGHFPGISARLKFYGVDVW